MHFITYNHNSVPVVINNLFIQNNSIHNHNTRACNLFHVQGLISTEAVNFIGPYLWLKLPNYIRDCSNLSKFLKLCKIYLNGETK